MEVLRGSGRQVNAFERAMLNIFLYKLRGGRSVLSYGCAEGVPYEQFLTMLKCSITGVDADKQNIIKAVLNVPNAKFVCADLLTQNPKEKFNGIMALDAHYFLPKEKHHELMCKLYEVLADEGILLITIPKEQSFNDADKSHYDYETTMRFLLECGFDPIVTENQGDYGLKSPIYWVLVRKKAPATQQMIKN